MPPVIKIAPAHVTTCNLQTNKTLDMNMINLIEWSRLSVLDVTLQPYYKKEQVCLELHFHSINFFIKERHFSKPRSYSSYLWRQYITFFIYCKLKYFDLTCFLKFVTNEWTFRYIHTYTSTTYSRRQNIKLDLSFKKCIYGIQKNTKIVN